VTRMTDGYLDVYRRVIGDRPRDQRAGAKEQ